MTIQPGTRLGPYEITAMLGAGGMGEVYRARDTRLDRTVAIKVLPQKAVNTTQARDRFEREARAVAALNHPNICALFDVGSARDTEYLVMELIEGESLADRIARGALPVTDVIQIGAAIADALAKAHRTGIIHRDLKPGNIMLTKSGPKLLDFGLARRAIDETPLVGHDAPTAVANKPITTDGMVLGTLPYMAPEQLEGKTADARTDLFALGAVLYEMLTGHRAFHAESQASLITKIMSVQPAPISETQPITPAALSRLVTRCLAKDADDRWQSAADVAAELRWIAEGTETLPSKSRRTWTAALPWVIAVALGAVALLAFRRPSSSSKTVRFEVSPPANTRFESNVGFTNLAVAPDGKSVAFLARETDRRIWILNLATGVSKPLDGTEQATAPFWSYDGKHIGFGAKGKLKTISIDDGRMQDICDVRPDILSATWLADGTIVFSQFYAGALNAVSGNGGQPRKLFGIPSGSYEVIGPSRIGGTNHFFFNTVENTNRTGLWIGSVDGSAPKKVLDEGGLAQYDAPYVTYVRDGTLFGQHFNERSLVLDGAAVPLAENIWFYKPLGHSLHAAEGDTIAYTPGTFIRSLHWIDRHGADLGEALPPGRYRNRVRVSPDGRYAVLAVDDGRTFMGDIWSADLHRQTMTRLTYGDHDYDDPIWSPDGTAIAFSSDPSAAPYVFTLPVGGGTPKAATTPGDLQSPTDWLKDGRILYGDDGKQTLGDILFANSNSSSEVWLRTPADEGDARVSPDGRWIAYASRDTDRTEVYVAPLDHHSAAVAVSNSGGLRPAWSPDGGEIYFKHQKELWAAKVKIAGNSIDTNPPQKFFTSTAGIEAFDVARDGRILVDIQQITPSTSPMHVIVGWKEEIARISKR